VLSPVIKKRDGYRIPHVYKGNRPCLYIPGAGEWGPDKYIAYTIVGWLSEWLYFYEVRHATGNWLGGGHELPPSARRRIVSIRRILAVDGGGAKGVFPLAFLASVEESISGPIAEFFDLVVGTSTAGIIALGLGLGFSASEMLGFYVDLIPRVFQGNRIWRTLRSILVAKWDKKVLRTMLAEKFGSRKLGHSKVRLVIPAQDAVSGQVHLYKTAHHPRFEKDYLVDAVDIALATAAAPTYFPTFARGDGGLFIDGGTWANNPLGVAVVEASAVLEWERASLRVLSLGCTTAPLRIASALWAPKGKAYWATKWLDLMLIGQSSGAIGTAQLIAGHENVHRISPVLAKSLDMDGVRDIRTLRGLGVNEARRALPTLRAVFFGDKAEAFVPYRDLASREGGTISVKEDRGVDT